MPPSANTLAEALTAERALIFRITHRDNLPHLLEHGAHCRSSANVNPSFVEIGHPDIIGRRKSRAVVVPPGGTLADYVPFYFTPCTPMMYNIVSGWQGLRKRAREEIAILVSSLSRIESLGIPYVVTDRNATLMGAKMSNGRELLDELPWDLWRARNFKHDSEDPGRVERYHAEILVHKVLPPSALSAIVTYDGATQATITEAVAKAGLTVPVHIRSQWYT